ncbi:hypothetical protein PHYNN_147 [Pantoea phage Phynn]|nr:hypothetical protein PHYNN_147 [Pantoea phage Phynn]
MFLLGWLIFFSWRYLKERRIWNGGICKKTGTPWIHTSTKECLGEVHRTECGKHEYTFHFNFLR